MLDGEILDEIDGMSAEVKKSGGLTAGDGSVSTGYLQKRCDGRGTEEERNRWMGRRKLPTARLCDGKDDGLRDGFLREDEILARESLRCAGAGMREDGFRSCGRRALRSKKRRVQVLLAREERR